jgi:hypothetical protein
MNVITQTNRYEATTSEKYKQINTDEIRQVLFEQGFIEVAQVIPKARKKAGFQRHLLRFTRPEFIKSEEQLEILITNAHDGTSSLRLAVGVFRYACSNGLIVVSNEIEKRIRHVGDWRPQVITGLQNIIAAYDKLTGRIDTFKDTEVDMNVVKVVLQEDRGTDAWTVLNVIQENLIRGGLTYKTTDGKRKKLKPLTSQPRIDKINRLVWTEFEKLVG